jgi:hypothetical protein
VKNLHPGFRLGFLLGLTILRGAVPQAPAVSTAPGQINENRLLVDILKKAADYCRRLESASLYYVSEEEITERIYIQGRPQQIEAVYLIKRADIQREEGNKAIRPRTQRVFVFLFEMGEWLPELDQAMGYFFDKVILSGDALEIITPVKPYKMRSDALSLVSKERLKERLVAKVKKDIIFAGAQQTNLLRELRDDAAAVNLQSYRSHLEQLEMVRKIDEQDLLLFARELKKQAGQKTVFLFYQRELLPQLATKKLIETSSLTFDDPTFQMDMADKSEDMFSAFNEIAQATGGISESSFNVRAAFAKAADASENYYLLYYRPKDYKADGKFKEIKVVIKGGGYRVTHRAGYFAN